MGKFSKAPEEYIALPQQAAMCDRCGWDFEKDNQTPRKYSATKPEARRFDPRNQINIQRNGMTIRRCSDCFERELLAARRHTKSGTDCEGMYREALDV